MDQMIETKRVALEMAIRALAPGASASEVLDAATSFEAYMTGIVALPAAAFSSDPHTKPHKAKADK